MQKKFAIITPYYKEDKDTLMRCIESVKRQTIHADHFLIADGYPQDWIGKMGEGVRHMALDKCYGDYGNTPRGIGAQLAISDKYDGIGFLDADNWMDDNHVETCLDSARKAYGDSSLCDYVIARRRFVRPDGSVMPVPEEPNHVDTSCFFLFPGAYFVAPYWNLMPREVAPLCDRVFYENIRALGLRVAVNSTPTVSYLSIWESHYRALNECPPENAKPNIDASKVNQWIQSLSEREGVILNRLTRRNIGRS
jgi:hypothetical protein